MERFGIYKLLYGISVILYILFLNFGFIDSIITGLFIVGTIYLIFTREESPDEEEDEIYIPEVHFYATERYNPYTYSMTIIAVIIAMVFYILQFLTDIRIGLIALALWPILIIAGIFIQKRVNQNLELFQIVNFISLVLPEDEDTMKLIIRKIEKEGFVEASEIDELLQENTDWPNNIRKRFINRYLEYSDFLAKPETDRLVSGEIEELNEERA